MSSTTLQEQKLLTTIDALADDIWDFTARLVAEPSTLGNEQSVTQVMAAELEKLDFATTTVPLDGELVTKHPGYAPVPWPAADRQNVIGQLEASGSGGKSALFNGHLDVVASGNHQYWSRDPFNPAVVDGWLYGRGAGDMKSGVAAMTYAAYAVHKSGFSLRAPFTVAAVLEEECCGNGAIATLAAGYDAEAVLIPEPFGPTILTDQLGVLWFKVHLSGKPAHVLQTESGVNAIEKCYALMAALRLLEEELNNKTFPTAYRSQPHPINLNIGIIEGGNWPSTVPAEASFHCRLSFFPNSSYKEMFSRIKDTINRATQDDPWLKDNPPTIEFYGFRSEGHSIERSLPALTMLDTCHRNINGTKAESYIATCTTDLRAYYHFGRGQATCYGPVAENIHGIDERVELQSIINVARVYSLFLARWCLLVE
jgi:acetylornithine deacetylase